MSLYPLRFEPIFKSMLWGGRRLPALLNCEPPHADPIGEAWVLSDVDGHPSRVADGPLAGITLRELLAGDCQRILGRVRLAGGRFPLLCKFIDARQELSVQVHPTDEQAARLGPGQAGKTEAWVILDACPQTSKIYAGLQDAVTADRFRSALRDKTTPALLHCFAPQPGDCVFLEAGTVHAIGTNVLLFEVQQTSDITYRLYDWDRVDVRTGRPRELHVEQGLACTNFDRGPCPPVLPRVTDAPSGIRESLVDCRYFSLYRHTSRTPFTVGAQNECRVAVGLGGKGVLQWRGETFSISQGDVFLLPAEIGECTCRPEGEIVVLECGVPE